MYFPKINRVLFLHYDQALFSQASLPLARGFSPGLFAVVSILLFVGTESDEIGQSGLWDLDDIAIIVFRVCTLLNVLRRDTDSQSNGLLGLRRSVTFSWIIGSPAGKQSLMICPCLRTPNISDTYIIRRVFYRFAHCEAFRNRYLNIHLTVAVTGHQRIAGRERKRLGACCGSPVPVYDLHDASQRTWMQGRVVSGSHSR